MFLSNITVLLLLLFTIASSLALTRDAHSGCPFTAVISSEILDERIDERCDDNITISWDINGTYWETNFKINISPPTEDDVSEIIELGYDLYDHEYCRLVLDITDVKEGVSYEITINLLGEDDETLDTALLISEDICQAEPCEDGMKCCDDGVDPICHCTGEYIEGKCDEDVDDKACDSSPCQNDGLCLPKDPGYNCNCPPGYGGTHCERLVLVPVHEDDITTKTHCTSVLIMWEASNVGLDPERYEVWGTPLDFEDYQLLCKSDHPDTLCFAGDLVRSATYLYEIVSFHGQEIVRSNHETFTLKDHPSFATCPSDTEPEWADGVNEIQIWWEEPTTECLSESTDYRRSNRPGDYFPIGTTTVTYELIDNAKVVDKCTFDVIVKERGVCTAYGDPHYMSFNNDYYSFQGVCRYILAATSQSVSPTFNVTVLNEEAESNPVFSITKEVNVTIYDRVISLMEDGKVRIDGIRVRLPANPVSNVFVVRNGMLVSLHTDFGFYVSFDGKHQVVVKAPADPYKYQVGGLCDHYGKGGSMYVMPGGAETEDVNEFGHSWAIEQCDELSKSPCTPADGNHKCDVIIDDQGPFKECHVIDEYDSYYQSCLTDYCATGDYCSAIEAYQRRCRDLGYDVGDWRDDDTCPIECEEGKEYRFCGSPCMNTCVEPDAGDNCPTTDCMEGCFCPDGTVLDDDKCVDPADCGCIVNGIYFSIGDIFIAPDCTVKCICNESKEMVCEELECDENASCLIRDGIRECVCDKPYYEGDGLVCTRKCDEPESPENGGKNENHNYPVSSGEEVTFYCDPGFMLYDPVTQSCLEDARTECDDGNWTNPVPECKENCEDPKTPDNGRQVGDIVYPVCTGTEVYFECDPGYELIGSPSTTCVNGNWSEQVPTCQGMCDDPGEVENGNPVDEPSYPVSEGTKIEYECDDGYSLYDPDLRVCLDEYSIMCTNGNWSNRPPTCQIMCHDPGQVDNGGLVNVPLFPVCEGTVLEYKCDPMYELIGSERIVCENGNWSDGIPECSIMCGDPGSPQYAGNCNYPDYPTSNGTVVEFCCDEGYDLIDPSDGSCSESYHSVCINGNWSHEVPSCKAECIDPGTPSNGKQVDMPEYPVCSGTMVLFECDEGHKLHGQEMLECIDGNWSSPIPSCNLTCGDPGHPENGSQVGDHKYPVNEGYIVEFECDDPYILYDNINKECVESASVTCDNGTWDDLPLCKRPCDDPGSPSNGSKKVEYEYPVCSGTIVEFRCDEGFELIGNDKTICNDSAWYDSILPDCVALCDDPGTPENGYQNEGHEYPVIEETKVTYGCLDGYNLHDPHTNECLEAYETICEGPNWTKRHPLCLLECEDPGTPLNGSQVEDHTYPVCSGTTVSFECIEDYFLFGENTLTCNQSIWNPPEHPTCLPGCHDPGTPDNGRQVDDHTYPVPPGTITRFCCDENFLLVGNQSLFCQDDGDWDGAVPLCEPMCGDPGTPENGVQVDVVEYPVPSGTIIHYDCVLGFEKHGKGFSECENGTWIPPPDDTYCLEIDECCSDPCKNGGKCIDGIGRYDCLCSPGFDGFNCGQEYGICYVWGDPHYITYDGEKYDFQGNCMYILTESATTEKTSFRVVVSNEAFDVGGETLSVTQELAVIVYGQEIRLMRDGNVMIDGSHVAVPYYTSSGIQVKQSGRYTNIYVDIGLVVRWDGHHYGDVKIPEDYKGIVRGLCGNFNGDRADDFMDPEYRLIPLEMEHSHRAAMFGNTWVANPEECFSEARGCTPCATDVDMAMQAHELCSLLSDPDGPFAACHTTVNHEDYFGACMFDLCAKLPDEQGLCMNAEAYAQACLDNFIPINWRSDVLCPITCDADKVYNASVPSCTSSCSVQTLYYECPERRLVDGCVCQEGKVLGTDEHCVPIEQCPCQHKSEMIEFGDSIISENCYEKCSCLENGRVDCISIRCDPNAFCGEKAGEHGCHCNVGFNGDGMRCSAILCDPNPCANGGTCTEHSNYYTCTCPAGFQGVRCKTAISACENNPCHHGGMCVTDDDGYLCLCADGFSGDNCERNDCLVDDVFSSDGSSWYYTSGDGCQLCSCNNGATKCKEFIASTYYNDHLMCQDDSDCGEYGRCERVKDACVGDECVKLCTSVAMEQRSNQDTCYDHLAGDYNKCLVIDVEFDQSIADALSICQDLSYYLRNNVHSVPDCSDIDCIDRNVLNKRRDVQKELRIVIEHENDLKSGVSVTIVKDIEEVFEKNRNDGTLKDTLIGITIVGASTANGADGSNVASWLVPTLMAVVAVAVVCVIGVVLYRRRRQLTHQTELDPIVRNECYDMEPYNISQSRLSDQSDRQSGTLN